jgi:predicted transcriptional regulator
MDQVELRARIRAMARDPETFAERAGLPVETVRQILHGEIINLTPWVRERLVQALLPDEDRDDEAAG